MGFGNTTIPRNQHMNYQYTRSFHIKRILAVEEDDNTDASTTGQLIDSTLKSLSQVLSNPKISVSL